MAMYFWLFGLKHVEVFQEILIYMLNLVVNCGRDFNWVDMLSYVLQRQVGQVKDLQKKNI